MKIVHEWIHCARVHNSVELVAAGFTQEKDAQNGIAEDFVCIELCFSCTW